MVPRVATATVLGALAVLHAAWGRGSTFPFAEPAELSDAVVGRPGQAPPPAAACFAVGGALAVAALVAADLPIAPRGLRRRAATVLTGVLALRGALGLTGHTNVLSPGSVSPRFRRNDRRIYAPLCLALAAGTASTLLRRR